VKWNIDTKFRVELENRIESALAAAFSNPFAYEPQLVANMIWHLPHHIDGISSQNGHQIRSSGIFIHGQPFVKCDEFPDPRPMSVELGDLLLLRTAVVNGVVSERRAMLLQAKKYRKGPVAPDNRNQQALYENWPTFEYVRSTPALNGKKRHLTGCDLYSAAKYLLIKDQRGCTPGCPALGLTYPLCEGSCPALVTAHPTSPTLSNYREFKTELFEFILGDAGKAFVSPPPKRERNWDKVIDDLTTITAERHSSWMRRASSNKSNERGQMLYRSIRRQMDFAVGTSSKHSQLDYTQFPRQTEMDKMYDGPPEIPPMEFDGEEYEDGGMSILEFVVSHEGGRYE